MAPEIEEVFNPGEYTDRELLKLVYRDLHSLREEFSDYKKNNNYNKDVTRLDLEVQKLKSDLEAQRNLRIEDGKRTQRLIAFGSLGLLVAQFILNLVIR